MMDVSAPSSGFAVKDVTYKTVPVDEALFNAVTDKTPVPLEMLEVHDISPADAFLPKLNREQKTLDFIPLIKAGAPVDSYILGLVRRLKLKEVYIPNDHVSALIKCCTQKNTELIKDNSITVQSKAKLLYGQAQLLTVQAFQEGEVQEALDNALPYVEAVKYLVGSSEEATTALGKLLSVDYSLFTHSINVSILSVGFADYIGMDTDQVHALGIGGLFHDIGKLRIDPGILLKKGPLESSEWDQMKLHPKIGHDILKEQRLVYPDILDVVAQHHENTDGTGYPYGLKGAEIGGLAQIAKIIDCYDAITSHRCYKTALPGFEALKIMHGEMSLQLSDSYFKSFIQFLGGLGSGAPSTDCPHTVLV